MKIYGFLLTFLVAALFMGTSSAEIYKWVDENGVVHFSDSPTEIESESSTEAENSSQDPNFEDTPAPTAETRNIILNPDFFKALDESRPDPVILDAPTVEIYETSWCGYCKKAKRFFRLRGIKFKAYNIERDTGAARRMMALTNRRAVPFVVINGHAIQGYSEQAYEHALRN